MSGGQRVSAGRLRVDAARAVDKLREYQLPDPTLWVLEVIRGAVAHGASRIEVQGDADDVRVVWHGDPIEAEALPRLFDELVDPAPRADRRALRLLATGVNTAIGLEPRWIDVISIDEASASRARYTARLLETGAEGAAERLRELRAEPVPVPPGAPERGGVVHLRRLPLWDAIGVMIGYGEPRELSVVRRSCDDLHVPIRVGRAELGIETSHGDLLRLTLGEGIEGFLALTDPTVASEHAHLDAAELGVVLARYTLRLEELVEPRAPVPLRLFVNAARMPTNASRSAVRLEDPPVSDAIDRVAELLPALVERLVRELSDDAEHDWSPIARERLRAAAIGLLAAACAGPDWRARLRGDDVLAPLPGWLGPLAEQPLLRDALGRPRAPRSFHPDVTEERVHFGTDPLGPDLEPWLGDSLWVPPGDPSRALLGGWAAPPADELASLVRRFTRRRQAFETSKRRDPVLEQDATHLLKVSLEAPGKSLHSLVPASRFDVPGLAGELALGDPAAWRRPHVTILIEGREIEILREASPVPVVAIATCDDLVPSYDFRSVRRDARAEALLGSLEASAVMACEALALRLEGDRKPGDRAELLVPTLADAEEALRERARDVLRGGIAMALELLASEARGSSRSKADDVASLKLGKSRSPLVGAAIWPVVGGEPISTQELSKLARREPKRIGFVMGGASLDAAPLGLPVIEVRTRADFRLLVRLLGRETLIDHGLAVRQVRRTGWDGPRAEALAPALGVALRVEERHYRAAIAWGLRRGSLEIVAWGRSLSRESREAEPPLQVVIEDARVVPEDGFDGVASRPEGWPIEAWSRRLARLFVDALSGDTPPDELAIGPTSALEATDAIEALMVALSLQEDPKAWLGARRLKRLRRAPIVRRLGTSRAFSVEELLSDYPQEIPWVPPTEAPLPEPDGFLPVVSTEPFRVALEKLSGRTLEVARDELESRRRRARRRAALAQHRERPEIDPSHGWADPVIPVKGKGFRSARAAASLAERGSELIALIEGRYFCTLREPVGVPIRAVVDLDQTGADADFEGLSTVGRRRARYVLAAGARALLMHQARNAPTALVDSTGGWNLMCGWLEEIDPSRLNRGESKLLARLAQVPAFPSVQGGRVSVAGAAKGSTLRVAVWNDPWLERPEGERRSAYDDPVIALPSQEPKQGELRAALKVLWRGQRVQDVTNAVARLQASRRVALGLTEVPRLKRVEDRRFRYSLDDLLTTPEEAGALEDLGIGEVALAPDTRTRVFLHREGRGRVELELNLIPRVHVAALSPLAARAGTLGKPARERIEDAVALVTSRVLRKVVDDTPPAQLPKWVRETLRDSCLAGGAEFFVRILDTPIFETTTGEWATARQVQDDADRWGEVWSTPEPRRLEPLEDRLALRLTAAEVKKLSEWVAAVDATEELALDQKARANMARPPVESLEPQPVEASAGAIVLPVTPTGEDPLEGTVTILRPGFSSLRGLYPSRGRHPLGRLEDPARWPTVARLDHPDLVPDRTWSAPEADDTLRRIEHRVRQLTWRALADLVPYPKGARFAMRVRPSGLDGVTVEGVAHLEVDGRPGEVRVYDGIGEREVPPSAFGDLPVSAHLWFPIRMPDARVRPMIRDVYARLLYRVAERLAADTLSDRETGIVQILRGRRLGVDTEAESLSEVEIDVFSPALSLRQALDHAGARVRFAVCGPDEAEDALEATGLTLIVDDGGEVASELLRLYEGRTDHWRERLAREVLGPDEATRPVRTPEVRAVAEAPSTPRSPLEQSLSRALPALGVTSIVAAKVDGRRKRPLALLVGDEVVFAGKDPVVKAAREAVDGGRADADAVAALLLARALGSLQRDLGRIGIAGQLGAMEALLMTVPRQ